MPICNLCHNQFPNRTVIDGKKRDLSCRKFCLECSPFGKRNTRSLAALERDKRGEKRCPKCEKTLNKSNFYVLKTQGNKSSPYCKPCTSDESKNRQRRFKKACVDYKGGKCEKCGYDNCEGALDFHHMDPNEKDFVISRRKSHKFDEAVINELDKCILLCSNCHREEHARQNGIL